MRDAAWVGQDAQRGGKDWKGCPGVYSRCYMGGVGCPERLNQENVGQGCKCRKGARGNARGATWVRGDAWKRVVWVREGLSECIKGAA